MREILAGAPTCDDTTLEFSGRWWEKKIPGVFCYFASKQPIFLVIYPSGLDQWFLGHAKDLLKFGLWQVEDKKVSHLKIRYMAIYGLYPKIVSSRKKILPRSDRTWEKHPSEAVLGVFL